MNAWSRWSVPLSHSGCGISTIRAAWHGEDVRSFFRLSARTLAPEAAYGLLAAAVTPSRIALADSEAMLAIPSGWGQVPVLGRSGLKVCFHTARPVLSSTARSRTDTPRRRTDFVVSAFSRLRGAAVSCQSSSTRTMWRVGTLGTALPWSPGAPPSGPPMPPPGGAPIPPPPGGPPMPPPPGGCLVPRAGLKRSTDVSENPITRTCLVSARERPRIFVNSCPDESHPSRLAILPRVRTFCRDSPAFAGRFERLRSRHPRAMARKWIRMHRGRAAGENDSIPVAQRNAGILLRF